jgi:hypothetical protein
MEPDRNQPHPKRHSQQRTDPGSYSWKLLLIKDARVHYVVLKQQPQTTHPTHNPRRATMHDRCSQETRNKQTRKKKPPALLPQDPTVCQTLPSGTVPAAFQDTLSHQGKKHPYSQPVRATRHLFVDIPPMSTRRRTIVCATGFYS